MNRKLQLYLTYPPKQRNRQAVRLYIDLVVLPWRLFLLLVLVLFMSVVRLLLLQLFGLVSLLVVQFGCLYLVGGMYEGWNFNFGNTPLDWIQ